MASDKGSTRSAASIGPGATKPVSPKGGSALRGTSKRGVDNQTK